MRHIGQIRHLFTIVVVDIEDYEFSMICYFKYCKKDSIFDIVIQLQDSLFFQDDQLQEQVLEH